MYTINLFPNLHTWGLQGMRLSCTLQVEIKDLVRAKFFVLIVKIRQNVACEEIQALG